MSDELKAPQPESFPLPLLIEVFAQEVVKQLHVQGDEARRYASDLGGRVQSLVKRFQLEVKERQQSKQTSSELEQLLDGIAQTGTGAGQIVAENRAAISEAFRGVDLARMSDGMGVLSSWLRKPAGEKLVKDLLDQLYAAMGVLPPPDAPSAKKP